MPVSVDFTGNHIEIMEEIFLNDFVSSTLSLNVLNVFHQDCQCLSKDSNVEIEKLESVSMH